MEFSIIDFIEKEKNGSSILFNNVINRRVAILRILRRSTTTLSPDKHSNRSKVQLTNFE